MTKPPEIPKTVDWALREFETRTFVGDADTMVVVGTLLENYHDPRITWKHGYRFLEFPGVIAEFGARILYIKTGRDNIDDHGSLENGAVFSTNKLEWRGYLIANGYNDVGNVG